MAKDYKREDILYPDQRCQPMPLYSISGGATNRCFRR
jgi:hypothetical protein